MLPSDRPAGSTVGVAEKVELHCHIDGLLGPSMLRRLIGLGHRYPILPEDLELATPVRSLEEWVRGYQPLVEPCLVAWQKMVPMLEAHIEDLVRQRVVYAEIMLSRLLFPKSQPDDAGAARERFRAFRTAADRAAAGRIQIELVVAIGRGPRARAERQAKRIHSLAHAGLICGVAVAGDESACSIESMADLLAGFRDAGLGIEIHAGEFAGPESVRDALEHGRPDRIGHAVRAFEDQRLVDQLCERRVHLELCPTSNYRLGVIDVEHHPIARARALGMSYSVNTDNPGPLGCSMDSELALLARVHGFSAEDFATIRANAWSARFAR